MTPATYNDINAASIPAYDLDGVKIKAIAGDLAVNDARVRGTVTGLSTDPAYLDIGFSDASQVDVDVPAGYTALVYFYRGSGIIKDSEYQLTKGKIARLSPEGLLYLNAVSGTKLLLITGKPIGEPIAQRGPFVMNTVDEIHQAIRDYSEGTLV